MKLLNCVVCGVEFCNTLRGPAKTCSLACTDEGRKRRRRKLLTCCICGIQFSNTRKGPTKCCSVECSRENWRRNHRRWCSIPENRARRRAQRQAYYDTERGQGTRRAWVENNIEHRRELHRAWCRIPENKERRRKRALELRAPKREQINAKHRIRYATEPGYAQHIRDRENRRAAERRALIPLPRCVMCGNEMGRKKHKFCDQCRPLAIKLWWKQWNAANMERRRGYLQTMVAKHPGILQRYYKRHKAKFRDRDNAKARVRHMFLKVLEEFFEPEASKRPKNRYPGIEPGQYRALLYRMALEEFPEIRMVLDEFKQREIDHDSHRHVV